MDQEGRRWRWYVSNGSGAYSASDGQRNPDCGMSVVGQMVAWQEPKVRKKRASATSATSQRESAGELSTRVGREGGEGRKIHVDKRGSGTEAQPVR